MKILHLGRAMLCMSSLACAFCGALPSAHAEGSRPQVFEDAWGVNRRIYTSDGFIAVSGTADLSFWMPTEIVNGASVVTDRLNLHDNKPSAYFGGQAPFALEAGMAEVDAGLQFESNVHRRATVGWSAFIANGSANRMADILRRTRAERFAFVRVWNNAQNVWVPWRGGTYSSGVRNGLTVSGGTGSISSAMRFDILPNGQARLILGAFGQGSVPLDPMNGCYWSQERIPDPTDPTGQRTVQRWENPDPDEANINHFRVAPGQGEQIFRTAPADLSRASIKRVVAMTRANLTAAGTPSPATATPAHSEPDGSYMTCTFTAGRVAQYGDASGLQNWQSGWVDQNRTGYDAPGDGPNGTTNHFAWDRLWFGQRTPYSRNKVEFSNSSTRPDDLAEFNLGYSTAARATVHDNNRYVTETVRINLRTVTRPIGEPLEYGTP